MDTNRIHDCMRTFDCLQVYGQITCLVKKNRAHEADSPDHMLKMRLYASRFSHCLAWKVSTDRYMCANIGFAHPPETTGHILQLYYIYIERPIQVYLCL